MESNVINRTGSKLSPDMVRRVVAAWVEIVLATKETIIEATQKSPLGGVPSGELYTNLMHIISLDQYMKLVATFKDSGMVIERNHLLVWVGPMPSKN